MSTPVLAPILELVRAGRLREAHDELVRLTTPGGADAQAWYVRSVVEQQLGLAAEALASAGQALALQPEQAAFHLQAGRACEDLRDTGGAIERFRGATELEPGWALAWASLGAALYEASRVSEAVEALARATALDRSMVRAWNNLGLALAAMDRREEARRAFEAALSLEPRHALARYNLARLAQNAGDYDEALRLALEATQVDPRLVDALLLAGDLYRKREDLPHAFAAYRAAVAAAPEGAKARNALAHLLWESGDVDGARAEFEATRRRHPGNLRAAIGARLLLPQVYAGAGHLEESRERYRAGLEALAAEAGLFASSPPSEVLSEARWTNFYLAYQGRDDRELQGRYGDFLHRVVAAAAPRLVEPRPRRQRAGGRLRVGFLSHFFFDCTAGRYFESWVGGLDPARFERFVYYTNAHAAEFTRRLAAAADHFRHLPGRPLATLAQAVLADDLDVLVFPELGMHEDTFALAATRLAPVQCAGWGHPTTTGLPTIDWFLTCETMEPEGAQSHYRERLVALPGLGTHYRRPSGAEAGTRADFGLPEDKHLYLVPQSVFKIHPDNDALLADVLARDPEGVAVMFAAGPTALVDALVRRLKPVFASRGLTIEGRLVFLPSLTHAAYLGVNGVCDVMLDTLHWSGGNTSLDAIASGLPIVTLPGALMRGRQSLGMLRILGLENDLVARDADEYAKLAVAIASDAERRRSLSAAIEERSGALFSDGRPIVALGEFLEWVAAA